MDTLRYWSRKVTETDGLPQYTWAILKQRDDSMEVIGYLDHEFNYCPIKGAVESSLASIPLPMFIREAAYDRKMGGRAFHEVIVAPMITGLWGLVSFGWPPKDKQ